MSTPHFEFDHPPGIFHYKSNFILFAIKSQEFSVTIPGYYSISPLYPILCTENKTVLGPYRHRYRITAKFFTLIQAVETKKGFTACRDERELAIKNHRNVPKL